MYDQEKKYLLNGFDMDMGRGFLSGGSLTSTFTNKPIKDYDLYFKSFSQFEESVEAAYDCGLWCNQITNRAVTFVRDQQVYQLMHFRFFEDPTSIFKSFDFTACMAAYDFSTGEIAFHDRFLADVSRRQLVFNHNTDYPIASAVRVIKYLAREFQITQREMLKVITACNFKDINSFADMADQIGGCYGESVALDTSSEYTLENAVIALDRASFEDQSEPRVADQVTVPYKPTPANSEECLEMLAALSGSTERFSKIKEHPMDFHF